MMMMRKGRGGGGEIFIYVKMILIKGGWGYIIKSKRHSTYACNGCCSCAGVRAVPVSIDHGQESPSHRLHPCLMFAAAMACHLPD